MGNVKKPAQIDIAVLLIFFTRTTTLKRTFSAIREARPTRLFLYQDGPRNDEEAKKIEMAKQIVNDNNIDWDCEVVRNYHTENSGAWASNFKAHQWAFDMADKCIVLEDDSTPSLSFIPFCKEMLDRYENDYRVTMISGFNFEEKSNNIPYDYFFSTVFSIWGWASWRRVVKHWEIGYPVVDDSFNMRQLESLVKEHQGRKEMLDKLKKHKKANKPIYESLFWTYNTLNSGLAVTPTVNLISNTAVSEESAHFQLSLKTMPRRMRQLLTMSTFDLTFPLRHPKYVIENVEYKQRASKIMAWGHPWIKIGRSFEELLLYIRYGDFRRIGEAVIHRFRKITGNFNYM